MEPHCPIRIYSLCHVPHLGKMCWSAFWSRGPGGYNPESHSTEVTDPRHPRFLTVAGTGRKEATQSGQLGTWQAGVSCSEGSSASNTAEISRTLLEWSPWFSLRGSLQLTGWCPNFCQHTVRCETPTVLQINSYLLITQIQPFSKKLPLKFPNRVHCHQCGRTLPSTCWVPSTRGSVPR